MKFIKSIVIAATAAIAVMAPLQGVAKKQKVADESADNYKLERAMGTVLGNALDRSVRQIADMGIDVDRQQVINTVLDVLNQRPTGFTLAEADSVISSYILSARTEAAKPLSDESQAAFLAAEAAQEGAVTMPSGLVFKVITEGEGPMPTDADSVRLLYTGSLSDGTVFDSTDEPVTFTVRNLVPGFTEGLKMMKPGGTYDIVFPASLGYGPEGIPGAIPGNAALKFRVNLLEILPEGK